MKRGKFGWKVIGKENGAVDGGIVNDIHSSILWLQGAVLSALHPSYLRSCAESLINISAFNQDSRGHLPGRNL